MWIRVVVSGVFLKWKFSSLCAVVFFRAWIDYVSSCPGHAIPASQNFPRVFPNPLHKQKDHRLSWRFAGRSRHPCDELSDSCNDLLIVLKLRNSRFSFGAQHRVRKKHILQKDCSIRIRIVMGAAITIPISRSFSFNFQWAIVRKYIHPQCICCHPWICYVLFNESSRNKY